MQATVTGVENGKITIEYVDTVEDNRLMQWYEDSHSEPIQGGGTKTKGEKKTGSIILYNQGGEEAARWNFTGAMPSSYKSSKLEAGATELGTETVEIVYENLHRVKQVSFLGRVRVSVVIRLLGEWEDRESFFMKLTVKLYLKRGDY